MMAQASPSARELYFDRARTDELQERLCASIDSLCTALGVSLVRGRKLYHGACPIHQGDNPLALNLYPEGERVPGYWVCNTRHCEHTFKPSILGFVRGVLSQQKYDWQPGGKKTVSYFEAVDWCCRFLGVSLGELEGDEGGRERRSFERSVDILTRGSAHRDGGIERAKVLARLEIPAPYFVSRGWRAETLVRYDVGTCLTPGKELYGRAVVPVYDEERRRCVGLTARSPHPQCPRCDHYHATAGRCPESRAELKEAAKWVNSGLDKESHLYNWWFARKAIEKARVACLVEGPGEVWRLEEAGFHCGLAMLGVSLSDPQQVLLERSGAMRLVVVTNNDAAGAAAHETLRKRLCRSFHLDFVSPPANDLGAMAPEAVRKLLGPFLGEG